MKNESIGKGSISANASANPSVKLEDVRKGTLPYWKFALDHVQLSPNKVAEIPIGTCPRPSEMPGLLQKQNLWEPDRENGYFRVAFAGRLPSRTCRPN